MTQPKHSTAPPPDPWGCYEPYVQLVRSLLPRATSVALFDAHGALRWSSDAAAGPDLLNLVDDALAAARSSPESPGQLRMLEGNLPLYLCSLRDDASQVLAIVAITCRATGDAEAEARAFALVHALLRPALECLRRDLMARVAIDQLNRTVNTLDKDVELLLGDGTADSAPAGGGGADGLKGILQQALDHLHCSTVALIVPGKSIAMVRTNGKRPADTQLVARAHRHLLSMAQMRRQPVIINQLAANSAFGILPYRILSCPLHSVAG